MVSKIKEDEFLGKFEQIKKMKVWGNFDGNSECHILSFYPKENKFNMNELEGILNSNQLHFLKFFLQKGIKCLYQQGFLKINNASLENRKSLREASEYF